LSNNVILDGVDMPSGDPRGWGIHLENVGSATVQNNVIANCGPASFRQAIGLDGRINGSKIFKVSLRDNVVSGWGGTTINILGEAGTQVRDISLQGNDLQNTVDTGYLLEVGFDVASNEVSSQANHFFSGPQPAGSWFLIGDKKKSLSAFKSTVGDVSSTGSQITYPATSASVATYHLQLGHSGSYEAFMKEVRLQSRDNWRAEFSAPAINTWIRAAFGH
jgi:hypothetical protein